MSQPALITAPLAAVTGSSIMAKSHKVNTILRKRRVMLAVNGRARMHPIGGGVEVIQV